MAFSAESEQLLRFSPPYLRRKTDEVGEQQILDISKIALPNGPSFTASAIISGARISPPTNERWTLLALNVLDTNQIDVNDGWAWLLSDIFGGGTYISIGNKGTSINTVAGQTHNLWAWPQSLQPNPAPGNSISVNTPVDIFNDTSSRRNTALILLGTTTATVGTRNIVIFALVRRRPIT